MASLLRGKREILQIHGYASTIFSVDRPHIPYRRFPGLQLAAVSRMKGIACFCRALNRTDPDASEQVHCPDFL